MLELLCVGIFLSLTLATVWLIWGFGRAEGGEIMTAIYLVSGLTALGLLVYLVVALLKPEKF